MADTSAIQPPVKPPARQRQNRAKSAARDVVIAARSAGHSIAECAKLAHVSETTASAWIKAIKSGGGDLSREGIISMLSQRLSSSSTADQYVAPLTAILAKLQGWTDKAADTVKLQPMGALFAAWRSEVEQEARTGTERESPADDGPGEPPIASGDEGVKPSPTPHQNFKNAPDGAGGQ